MIITMGVSPTNGYALRVFTSAAERNGTLLYPR